LLMKDQKIGDIPADIDAAAVFLKLQKPQHMKHQDFAPKINGMNIQPGDELLAGLLRALF
jgi:hypothetical protein